MEPRGTALWLVDDANPDGSAAGTRHNANGVDLNRNFPYRWQPQDGAYETVLRDALAVDPLDRVGVYFGTRSGKLFGSPDEGDA